MPPPSHFIRASGLPALDSGAKLYRADHRLIDAEVKDIARAPVGATAVAQPTAPPNGADTAR
jgi:hypothetical protein